MPYKDTDYLALSAALHARQTQLLTRDRRDALIDAPSAADTLRLLAQSGYGEAAAVDAAALEQLLTRARSALFDELSSAVPERRIVDVFRLKYDYHNAKVLLKARKSAQEAQHLLIGCGRYAPAVMEQAFARDDYRDLSPLLREAIGKAAEVLTQSADAQAADLILDRACYAEMCALAKESGSRFLSTYVALNIDAVNLRTTVRAARMGREREFLLSALLDGGTISPSRLAAAQSGTIAALIASGAFSEAGAPAAAAMAGEKSLTAFEKACDNAINSYLSAARRTPFGEEVVIGYLHAKEAELTAVRTIVSGKLAGLAPELIRERLRDTYL